MQRGASFLLPLFRFRCTALLSARAPYTTSLVKGAVKYGNNVPQHSGKVSGSDERQAELI